MTKKQSHNKSGTVRRDNIFLTHPTYVISLKDIKMLDVVKSVLIALGQ